ncbi:MAG: bifunctional DNA-formamidopyrimidine glycosylase/DNA-(apurinic or apyrimidinic site) lyase [Candidatus Staskawiczbacteria bacterium]|nr:bifunctional DNA-formamidopyrimidine glycosylase/DNA-(apurinic or apyrimidinic site) lyase [Candidatus Staskawiczbacteria bacterium]
MPELPEVQTTVDGLNKKVLKSTFVDVWSDWSKIVKKPRLPGGQAKNFDAFKKEIKNKKIEKIWRRAKNIIFDLSEGHSLLVHQKMTGHLLVGNWQLVNGDWKPIDKKSPLNDPYNRFLHLVFFLDNKKMLALSDARKFAKVELWKTEELKKELDKLGPEPLEKSFTFEKFKEILKDKNGKVKQVLMKPEVIAGIGNIYSSEILWQSKIHPEKSVAKLNEKELKLIYQNIKKVLETAVKLGGESFSDYRKPDGTKGDFDSERRAYNREGQKCSRCGTKIKRIHFGGRSAFLCPNCQKL